VAIIDSTQPNVDARYLGKSALVPNLAGWAGRKISDIPANPVAID